MKNFIKFVVFWTLSFFFLVSPACAHGENMESNLDSVFIDYFGANGRFFEPTMILPRTSVDQPDLLSNKDQFGRSFRVEGIVFGEIGKFLRKQKSKWGVCDFFEKPPEAYTFRVRWNISDEKGVFCVTSKDAIKIFVELNRISDLSSNKNFSLLIKETIASLRQIPG